MKFLYDFFLVRFVVVFLLFFVGMVFEFLFFLSCFSKHWHGKVCVWDRLAILGNKNWFGVSFGFLSKYKFHSTHTIIPKQNRIYCSSQLKDFCIMARPCRHWNTEATSISYVANDNQMSRIWKHHFLNRKSPDFSVQFRCYTEILDIKKFDSNKILAQKHNTYLTLTYN